MTARHARTVALAAILAALTVASCAQQDATTDLALSEFFDFDGDES